MKIDGRTIHPDVTLELVVAAVVRRNNSLDDPGFCIACGCDFESGIEPDAREYECEACGELAVYGADELLLHMAV